METQMEQVKLEEVPTAQEIKEEVKRRVFIIDPPTDRDGGEYLLFVYKTGPFGGGSSTIFAVDRCLTIADKSGRAVAIQGWRGNSKSDVLITEFPIGTAYMLVHRTTVRALTFKEMRTEEEQDRKDFGEPFPPEGGDAPNQGHGNYI